MAAEKNEIARVILGYVEGDGKFPDLISQKILELGITPNDIFRAYLENTRTKEPTNFLVENFKDISLGEEEWELFINRIKSNPNVSSELMNCFYHKDKNFYINVIDKMLSMFGDSELTEQEADNLLYFLEENKIWI